MKPIVGVEQMLKNVKILNKLLTYVNKYYLCVYQNGKTINNLI